MKPIRLAILGATGLVGSTMLSILEERDLPIEELHLFASARSAGKEVEFKGQTLTIEELTPEAILEGKFDYILFAAGGDRSREYAPYVKESGAVMIDNSSVFRMTEGVPLVVPEINGENAFENDGLIANPNCSTIQSVVALGPIEKHYGLRRVVYNTYQSVSGSGQAGIEDLKRGLEGGVNKLYPYQIANNILPHIDDFLDTGYTKEEMKMVNETRKMFHDPDMKVTATAVRVPVFSSHAVSINVETERPVDLEELRQYYREAEGIVLLDDPQNLEYPTSLATEGTDEVYVGRLRLDDSVENGLNLWCTADNIRKGAALNAVQILELLLKGEN